MTTSLPDDALSASIAVPLGREEAFAAFTDLGGWWPAAYSWSQDALEAMVMEPRQGGRCYEVGPHGVQCDWGRVLAVEPPHRLVFAWQIGPRREPVPDPAKASEVAVAFTAENASMTRIDLVHSGFARHGGDWRAYRDALASEHGWPYMLTCFETAVTAS